MYLSNQDCITRLHQIAQHLPGFVIDREHDGRLIGPKGEFLYLNGNNKRGMLTLSLAFPMSMSDYWTRYASHRESRPDSIFVAETKTGQTIALDIKRRLFPAFYAALSKAEAVYQEEREECAREWDAAKRLADAMGGAHLHGKPRYDGSTPPPHMQHPAAFGDDAFRDFKTAITVEVNEDTEGELLASIKLQNLSVDFAHEIIRFTRAYLVAQQPKAA
jgi:hypothetical protein